MKELVSAPKSPRVGGPVGGLYSPETSIQAKNLFMRINQLEQKLTPVINFINNLQKQLAEEEKSEQKDN